jgi:CubicO group peptidase (beta-lactamase class C family)
VVGASVLVLHRGTVVVNKAYGYANREQRIPATPRTVYRIGSITKQLTAVAVLQLAAAGGLALDDRVAAYLPGLGYQEHQPTVREVLAHTSGIRSYTDVGVEHDDELRANATHDVILRRIITEPFDFPPGARWHYSNSGYYLLGLVIEKVSGTPYHQYLRQRIFEPAGMASTFDCDPVDALDDRVQGYVVERVSPRAVDAGLALPSFAAGSLCSTTEDLGRWLRALDSGRELPALWVSAMRSPGRLNTGMPHGYGLGVFVGRLGEYQEVSHNGRLNGFASFVAEYPGQKLGIIVLTNTESPDAERMGRAIARGFLGIPSPVDRWRSPPPGLLSRCAGRYFDGPVEVPVDSTADGLRLRTPGGLWVVLHYQAGTTFAQADDPAVQYTFTVRAGRAHRLQVRIDQTLLAMAYR